MAEPFWWEQKGGQQAAWRAYVERQTAHAAQAQAGPPLPHEPPPLLPPGEPGQSAQEQPGGLSHAAKRPRTQPPGAADGAKQQPQPPVPAPPFGLSALPLPLGPPLPLGRGGGEGGRQGRGRKKKKKANPAKAQAQAELASLPTAENYLDAYPAVSSLMKQFKWYAGKEQSPLAVVNEYAARMMQQVVFDFQQGGHGGGFWVEARLMDKRSPEPQEVGRGRARNKQTGKQVAAAALLEQLLETGLDAESLLNPNAGDKAPKKWQAPQKPGLGVDPATLRNGASQHRRYGAPTFVRGGTMVPGAAGFDYRPTAGQAGRAPVRWGQAAGQGAGYYSTSSAAAMPGPQPQWPPAAAVQHPQLPQWPPPALAGQLGLGALNGGLARVASAPGGAVAQAALQRSSREPEARRRGSRSPSLRHRGRSRSRSRSRSRRRHGRSHSPRHKRRHRSRSRGRHKKRRRSGSRDRKKKRRRRRSSSSTTSSGGSGRTGPEHSGRTEHRKKKRRRRSRSRSRSKGRGRHKRREDSRGRDCSPAPDGGSPRRRQQQQQQQQQQRSDSHSPSVRQQQQHHSPQQWQEEGEAEGRWEMNGAPEGLGLAGSESGGYEAEEAHVGQGAALQPQLWPPPAE